MPSPLDIPHIKGVDEDGNEVERKTSDSEPFSALALKLLQTHLLVNYVSSEYIQEH